MITDGTLAMILHAAEHGLLRRPADARQDEHANALGAETVSAGVGGQSPAGRTIATSRVRGPSTPNEPDPSGLDLALAVWPNPSTDAATVRVSLDAPASARVVVFDVLGREVAVLHEGELGAGPHAFPLASALPAGTYVVRPPGLHPARKIRVLTETLIDYFERHPDTLGKDR